MNLIYITFKFPSDCPENNFTGNSKTNKKKHIIKETVTRTDF